MNVIMSSLLLFVVGSGVAALAQAGELEGRLHNALEGLIFALVIAGLFFLIALIARVAFKKRIDSPRFYTIAIVSGFILHRALISVLSSEASDAQVREVPSSSLVRVGLDAPFIAPAEEDLESFPAQLNGAIAQLPAEERIQFSDAISFLAFSVTLQLAEQRPTQLEDAEDSDIAAMSLVRLYRFAQKQGGSMTLRGYIDLAEEMKRQKPDWWAQFQEAQVLEHPSPMSIRADPPDWYKRANGNKAWNVVLDGEIDPDAPARIAETLKRAGPYGADVYINSPGGDLFASMEIGRLLRKTGANTHIARLVAHPTLIIAGEPLPVPKAANCLSACTLAFLGGAYRYSTNDSQFGVHRFYSDSAPSSSDLDVAQIMSAAVSAYIREMDVDPGLFDLMVQSGKDEITIVGVADLKRLNVINDGRKRPEWSIEVVKGAQYLRGAQDTAYGRSKVLLTCDKNRMFFGSVYEAGEKAKSLAGWYHSLMLNDDLIPLPEPMLAVVTDEVITTEFPLTKDQALTIASSSSVGHAMQLGRDAPTFVGYKIDIPSTASEKVATFIGNCFASQ